MLISVLPRAALIVWQKGKHILAICPAHKLLVSADNHSVSPKHGPQGDLLQQYLVAHIAWLRARVTENRHQDGNQPAGLISDKGLRHTLCIFYRIPAGHTQAELCLHGHVSGDASSSMQVLSTRPLAAQGCMNIHRTTWRTIACTWACLCLRCA